MCINIAVLSRSSKLEDDSEALQAAEVLKKHSSKADEFYF